jgi:plastocyanin
MKTKFTTHALRFYTLTCILAYLSLSLSAQTSQSVTVSSNKFSPSSLTITAGDEVIWTNTEGSHNVDGQKTTFPNNPVSFGNDVGAGWTFKFTFNTAGTYDYQCDPHAAMGMLGRIIVNPKTVTSSQTLADGTEKIHLYPNPSSQSMQLIVPSNYAAISSIKVYTIAGSVVDEKLLSGNAESLRYDVSQFKNGIYLMEITAGNQRNVLKFMKQ